MWILIFVHLLLVHFSEEIYHASKYETSKHPHCRFVTCYGLNKCRMILNFNLCPNADQKTCQTWGCVYEYTGTKNSYNDNNKNLDSDFNECLDYEYIPTNDSVPKINTILSEYP